MAMLEGTITNGVHRLSLRVYYEDTDFSGLVYHANYLKFCERGRSDFMRVVGVDQNAMFDGEDRSYIVIRKMNCDFLKPARFDEVLEVETVMKPQSGVRLEMTQRVLRGEDVLFSAEVMAVIVGGNGRPRRPNAAMMAALARFPS
jgi:acyl-CoA thioester hydrolase